jgi:ketosteroid isomerase-like protein
MPPAHPTPPPNASHIYTALHATVLDFITAQTQTPALASRMDFSRMRALCAPEFQHSWGHNYATSLNPRLQGTVSIDEFIEHLESLLPALESWEATATDVLVDEVKRTVVLRASLMMVVKGEEKGVENDLLWVFEMKGEGSEMKIRRSREFIDGVAAARLKELMMGRK